MRTFLRPAILALLFLPAFLVFAAERNIIFFITDDQSPDGGCYGSKVLKTPNLDKLAADGTLFTHAFATTASCSASRSVVMSGLHNHANGQYGHQHHYHKFASYRNVLSMPVVLGEAGYDTMQIGKYHVAPEEVYRFGSYAKANPRNPVEMADKVNAWLGTREEDSARAEKPFFIYFATSDPHRSGGDVDKTELAANLFGNKRNGESYPGVTETFYKTDEVDVPPFLPDTKACREELVQYSQSVSRIDFGLGRLVEVLKERGLYEKTLIVFTADHGMAFPGGKTTVYEGGLRVPFVVRNPYEKKRGVVSSAMISHVDIAPSLIDFAGTEYKGRKKEPAVFMENQGPVRKKLHGRSWIPILSETEAEGWDEIGASHTFHEIQMYYPMRVFRDRKYKLIWNIAHGQPYPFASDLWAASTWQAQWAEGEYAPYGFRTVKSYIHRPEFEFFDMVKDPNETKNLSDSPEFAEVLATYKKKLKGFQQATDDPWVMKWRYE